jgi:hypothetical protein
MAVNGAKLRREFFALVEKVQANLGPSACAISVVGEEGGNIGSPETNG